MSKLEWGKLGVKQFTTTVGAIAAEYGEPCKEDERDERPVAIYRDDEGGWHASEPLDDEWAPLDDEHAEGLRASLGVDWD